jgi:hypothetical protein
MEQSGKDRRKRVCSQSARTFENLVVLHRAMSVVDSPRLFQKENRHAPFDLDRQLRKRLATDLELERAGSGLHILLLVLRCLFAVGHGARKKRSERGRKRAKQANRKNSQLANYVRIYTENRNRKTSTYVAVRFIRFQVHLQRHWYKQEGQTGLASKHVSNNIRVRGILRSG